MSKLFISIAGAILIAFTALPAQEAEAGDVYVRGHYRSNGSYVQPHYRSSPDSYKGNNYSAKGNVNPYTGRRGSKNANTLYGGSTRNLYGGNTNNLYGGNANSLYGGPNKYKSIYGK